MTQKPTIEAWMNHPEAVAQTFEEMQDYIDRLRSERDRAINALSQGRFESLDNGVDYYVAGYAGGASKDGVLSYVTIMWTDSNENKTWLRKYEPAEDWIPIMSSKK